jgi:hypothetical protein
MRAAVEWDPSGSVVSGAKSQGVSDEYQFEKRRVVR